MRGLSSSLAGLLMLAGGFFDLVDGVVARHQGISTRYGAFLDSTLDRLVDVATLSWASRCTTPRWESRITSLLVGAATVSTVLVSYAKARAELEIASFEVGLLERGERIGLLAVGALFGFLVSGALDPRRDRAVRSPWPALRAWPGKRELDAARRRGARTASSVMAPG